MINTLYKNLVLEIINYLTDTEAKKLSETCKSINKLGYLKYIFMKCSSDPFDFALAFSKHNLTLNKVVIYKSLVDPQIFMSSSWPKSVSFYYSKFTSIINPNASKTENLKIFSLHNLYNKSIKLNWSKFHNLRNLYLYCEDVDLNELENCQHLENIFIYLLNVKTIDKVIGSLKNLRCIITNCDIESGTHFISKKIDFFVAKNMNNGNFKFKSTFKIIKNRNLYPYSEETIFHNYNGNF